MKETNEEIRRQMERLERGALELKHASRKALGFVTTVEYLGISFNVSRLFVIADLSPLAFFHLIERIAPAEDLDADQNQAHQLDHARDRASGIEAAVLALHHRLLPLLSCTHRWTRLKRSDDERVLSIMASGDRSGPLPRICKACTAYALEQSLPVVGRTF